MSIYEGKLELSVTTASGIEAVTKRELNALGYEAGGAEFGRISFAGSYRDMARCNLFLRTANRVYINLIRFEAVTFDELFEGIYRFNWAEALPKDAKIVVNAKSVKSTLFAVSSIQSICKKAIVKRLMDTYRISRVAEDGAAYTLDVSIVANRVLVALETSGSGLHKRGYRTFVGEAPLRETLASAILLLSVWKWDRPLVDTFTGSGTIPIEAALIATNTAPGLNRDFAFSAYTNAPAVLEGVRAEARDQIIKDRSLRISGFDINPEAIKLANRHAEAAGVKDYIHFQTADMRTVKSRYSHGVIVTNPPYGERLLEGKELTDLYRDFGKLYRSLDEWSLYAITSYGNFERCFGKRADRTRKLYNSELECTLYQYLGAPPQRKP